MNRLYKFKINTDSNRAMLGSFMASHAISDSLIFLAITVGCKAKLTHVAANHDAKEDFGSRMGWSEFEEKDLISGNLYKLKRSITGQLDRFKAGFMPVVISPLVKTLGLDVKREVEQIQKDIDMPIRYVQLSSAEASFWEGYLEVMKAFATVIDWGKSFIKKKSVNIWGYPFDRFEEDHNSNIKILKNLLEQIGITTHAIFFSGSSTEELKKAKNAEYNIILPHASRIGKDIEDISKRKSIYTDLPIGIQGSKKWIKTIASKVGTSSKKTGILLEELDSWGKNVPENKDKKNVALITDTPWSGGLCKMLIELGEKPCIISLRDRYLGGRDIFQKLSKYHGFSTENIDILETTDHSLIKQKIEENNIYIVIGPETDTSLFSEQHRIKKISFGFPSYNTHYTEKENPTFGAEGIENWRRLLHDEH